MKKITILLVIIFTFLFSTTSWGEWNFVIEDMKGDNIYYDKDRVRKSGKYLYFWELHDYIKPNKWGNLSGKSYIQLDCSIFRFKYLKFQFYKNSMGLGEQTSDFTPEDEWNYPQPESVGESVFNKICEEHGKKVVQKRQKGVLFGRLENGKLKWFEDGDEENDYKYVGEIKNGKPDGQGTNTFVSGLKYVGEWKDGKNHGQGTEITSEGLKFVGEYKNGKWWNGTLYNFNGDIITVYEN